MADLEDDLRRVLSDPAYALPPWPDAVERIRSGMRRRHGRRLLTRIWTGTAAVVAVLSATVGPSLLSTDRPAPLPSPEVIPWRDLPYADPAVPSLVARPAATTCQAADLRLVSVETDGAGGTTFHTIRLRNDGTAACTLPGRPQLRGTIRGRTRTIATKPSNRDLYAGTVPATIEPDEAADGTFETYGGCLDGRAETVYTAIRVVSGDGEVRVPGEIDATCGVGVGQWHRFTEQPGEEPSSLLVTLTAPPTARLGSDLSFVVTLTNPTGRTVALDPCPNYMMSVSLKIVAVGSHQLDCTDGQGQTRIVAAGASLSFAMRLPLALGEAISPGPGQVGPAQLTWSMGVTSATVDITILA